MSASLSAPRRQLGQDSADQRSGCLLRKGTWACSWGRPLPGSLCSEAVKLSRSVCTRWGALVPAKGLGGQGPWGHFCRLSLRGQTSVWPLASLPHVGMSCLPQMGENLSLRGPQCGPLSSVHRCSSLHGVPISPRTTLGVTHPGASQLSVLRSHRHQLRKWKVVLGNGYALGTALPSLPFLFRALLWHEDSAGVGGGHMLSLFCR